MKKILLLVPFLLLCGCTFVGIPESEIPLSENPFGSQEPGAETQFCPDAVWCVYWDAKVSEPLAAGQWEEAVLFACYYDDTGALYIPPKMKGLRETVEGTFGGKRYISVTNDVQLPNGTAIQKDPALLERLFRSTDEMDRRVEDLLTLAEDWNCGGIEVDYEKLSGTRIWESYVQFIQRLWERAQERGLSVRIVLPCSAPTGSIVFPEGPQYVVMCYNLYGYHSGPGPKADLAFLKGVAQRFAEVPGVSYALSNGGFDWDASGKVCGALVEAAAAELLETRGSGLRRDPASQALSFTYPGGDGTHTVWYADRETLAAWKAALDEAAGDPVSVNLWRLESIRITDEMGVNAN